ncbi:MAG: TerB family tellurite resistance protein [Nannocystaceae bacterium]
MDFRVPTRPQLVLGLRALATIAAVDGPRNAGEEAMLVAAWRGLGGEPGPLPELAPITPEALAQGIEDRQIRFQLVGAMLVMSMADGELDPAEAALVSAFAAALEVADASVANLERLAAKRYRIARLDILRRQWAALKIRDIAAAEGPGIYWRSLLGILRRNEDPALAARFRAFAELPAGSLGRAYYDFTAGNGFAFPGELGAPPEVITFHDMTHVLAGYSTSPGDELLVAAFTAGYVRREPLDMLMFVLPQFQLGIEIAPGVAPEYDYLDPARLLRAVRRGAAMNINLNEGWDYFDVVGEPVAALRERYNILPEERFAGPIVGAAT